MITSDVRLCKKCRFVKPVEEFYPYQPCECKDCVRKRVRANRNAKADYYRAYDRERSKLQHRIDKNVEITKRWRQSHPERWRAHIALNNAVRTGEVHPMPCLICGEHAEAHHPDYSRPLDVVWLCPLHHKQAHALVKKAA